MLSELLETGAVVVAVLGDGDDDSLDGVVEYNALSKKIIYFFE